MDTDEVSQLRRPCSWLAAGAFTIGIGAVMGLGIPVAHADAGSPADSAGSSHSGSRAPRGANGRVVADRRVVSRSRDIVRRAAAPAATAPLTDIGLRVKTPAGSVPDLAVVGNALRDFGRRFRNRRPTASPTLSGQEADGKIRGSLNATDAEGDPLTYSLTANPVRGTVSVNPAGDFVYAPGTQIAATGGTDSFTVVVDDGRHGSLRPTKAKVAITVVPVVVAVGETTASVLAKVGLEGNRSGTATFSPDGTRAVVTSEERDLWGVLHTTFVTVIDAVTGKQIGSTTTLPGPVSPILMSSDGTRVVIADAGSQAVTIDVAGGTQVASFSVPGLTPGTLLNPDGSRAVFTRTVYDSMTGSGTTTAAVVDTTTGAQIAPPITIPGTATIIPSADGSRAVAISLDVFSTRMTTIDTAAGTQLGATVTFPGYARLSWLSPDGTSALLSDTIDDPVNGGQLTEVSVIDTLSGAAIHPVLTFPGNANVSPVGADGTRALITFTTDDGNTESLAMFDTTAGVQIGTTLTTPGSGGWSPVLSSNGLTAMVTGSVGNDLGNGLDSPVAFIDTTTGTPIGGSVTVRGDARMAPPPVLSGESNRAVVLAGVYDASTGSIGFDIRVTVVDSTRSAQIGTGVTVPGEALVGVGAMLLGDGGTRAIVTTEYFNGDTRIYSTRVAVVDTVTGAQLGSTLNLSGRVAGSALLNMDGTFALVATDRALTVIDLRTGAQSDSLAISGTRPVLNADRSRALALTVVYNPLTRANSVRAVVLKIA